MKSMVLPVSIVLGLVVIGVSIFFVVKERKKKKDNYCICSHGSATGRTICQPDMKKSYRDGLTEYTDFAAEQEKNGGAKWPRVSPGDYGYPEFDKGCGISPLAGWTSE